MGEHVRPGGPGPLNSNSIICSMGIFPSFFFFFEVFVRKNWQGEGVFVRKKWYNRWLRLLNMLFPGRIYISRGPWHSADFCNIFLPNISEDQ